MFSFRSPSRAKASEASSASPAPVASKPSSVLDALMSTPFEADEVAAELLPPLSEYEAQGAWIGGPNSVPKGGVGGGDGGGGGGGGGQGGRKVVAVNTTLTV